MTIPDDALETFKPRLYAQVRKLVRDGDLFLCQGRDPFSRLIQWSTKSPWSHIAIAFRVPDLDRVMVIEAVQSIGGSVGAVGRRSKAGDVIGLPID